MNRILEYLSILPSLSHHLFRIIINFNDLSFPFAKEHVAAKIEGEGRGGGDEWLNSNRQFYSKDSHCKKKKKNSFRRASTIYIDRYLGIILSKFLFFVRHSYMQLCRGNSTSVDRYRSSPRPIRIRRRNFAGCKLAREITFTRCTERILCPS